MENLYARERKAIKDLQKCYVYIYMSVGVYVDVYLSKHPGFERLRLEAVWHCAPPKLWFGSG